MHNIPWNHHCLWGINLGGFCAFSLPQNLCPQQTSCQLTKRKPKTLDNPQALPWSQRMKIIPQYTFFYLRLNPKFFDFAKTFGYVISCN